MFVYQNNKLLFHNSVHSATLHTDEDGLIKVAKVTEIHNFIVNNYFNARQRLINLF